MLRTLRTVLLMAAGLAVLVRLMDAWSEARLTLPARRRPAPPAPSSPPAVAGGDGACAASAITVPWDTPVLPEGPAAPADDSAARTRAAEEAVRALTETLAQLAAATGPAATGPAEAPTAVVAVADPEPAPPARATRPTAIAGTFAVSGDADAAGRVVWAPVAFAEPLAAAPTGWGREDGQAWPAGTIVLDVTETRGCTPDDVAVVFSMTQAPTTAGFTVRVACARPGPFAATGTYRVV